MTQLLPYRWAGSDLLLTPPFFSGRVSGMGQGPQLPVRVWPPVREWKWGPGGLFRVLVPGWVLFSVGIATCGHGLGIDMVLVGSG